MHNSDRLEELAPPQSDERSRQLFVSRLRRFIMEDMAKAMRADYDKFVAPGLPADPGPKLVRDAMRKRPSFGAYSVLRYNAQEMVWDSVQDQVERNRDRLNEDYRREDSAYAGSLQLNPSLTMPRDITAMDIHLMPGCWQEETEADDSIQGAVYELGTQVFGGGLKLGPRGGVAWSTGRYVQVAHPELKPRRILDIGCTVGTNTLPYGKLFPEAELYGVDVGAPQLRHGHARARAENIPIHFVQADAEELPFADGFFDLVVSSFFFHELSLKSTQRILQEIHRTLNPGGLTLNMELPDASQVDPYYNFYLDWDAYYNNEPHYASFRAQRPDDLMTAAGFAKDDVVCVQVPNYAVVDPDFFDAAVRGEKPVPAHGNGASWFLFGAFKSA